MSELAAFAILLLVFLVIAGIGIAKLVSNARLPVIESLALTMLGAAVPALWWGASGSKGGWDFSDLWPYVFLIFFVPTALTAVICSLCRQRSRQVRSNNKRSQP